MNPTFDNTNSGMLSRDEAYIAQIEAEVIKFNNEVAAEAASIRNYQES